MMCAIHCPHCRDTGLRTTWGGTVDCHACVRRCPHCNAEKATADHRRFCAKFEEPGSFPRAVDSS